MPLMNMQKGSSPSMTHDTCSKRSGFITGRPQRNIPVVRGTPDHICIRGLKITIDDSICETAGGATG